MMHAFSSGKHLFREARMLAMAPGGAGAPGAPGETPAPKTNQEKAKILERIVPDMSAEDAQSTIESLVTDLNTVAEDKQSEVLQRIGTDLKTAAEAEFEEELQTEMDAGDVTEEEAREFAAELVTGDFAPAAALGFKVTAAPDGTITVETSGGAVEKKNRPEPKTVGEKLEQTMEDAMEEFQKAMADGNFLGMLKAGIKGFGALMMYFKKAGEDGGLDAPLKNGQIPAEKDDKSASPEAAKDKDKNRKELQDQLRDFGPPLDPGGLGSKSDRFLQYKKDTLGDESKPASAKGKLKNVTEEIPKKEDAVRDIKAKIEEKKAAKALPGAIPAAIDAEIALLANGNPVAAAPFDKGLTRLEQELTVAKQKKEDLTKEVAKLEAEIPELAALIKGLDKEVKSIQYILRKTGNMMKVFDSEFAKKIVTDLANITVVADGDTLGGRIVGGAEIAKNMRVNISALVNGNNGDFIELDEMGITKVGADAVVDLVKLNAFIQGLIDKFKLNAENNRGKILKNLIDGNKLDGSTQSNIAEDDSLGSEGLKKLKEASETRGKWVDSGSKDLLVTSDSRIFWQNANGKGAYEYDVTADNFIGRNTSVFNTTKGELEDAPLKLKADGTFETVAGSYVIDDVNHVYDRKEHVWKQKL